MKYSFQILTRDLYNTIPHHFHCGNNSIDNFINDSICLDNAIGKTYVLLDDDQSVVSYFNITTSAILDPNNFGLKLGGSVHINKFALAKEHHGSFYQDGEEKIKLSDFLFLSCLLKIIELRDSIGYAFIPLCSTEEGVHLYQRAGFEIIEEDMRIAHDFSEKGCHEMYLALDLED